MILYKKEPLQKIPSGVVPLECEDGKGFIYLSLYTYKQCVLLQDRYDGDINIIAGKLVLDGVDNPMMTFVEYAPEPLYMLAPFLGLLDANVDLKDDFEKMCGVLHEMSNAINFNKFIEVNYKVRADIKFGKALLVDYKNSWDDIQMKIRTDILPDEILAGLSSILTTCTDRIIEKIQPAYALQQMYPANMIYNPQQKEEEEDDEEVEVDSVEDFWAALSGELSKDKEGEKDTKVEMESMEVTQEKQEKEVEVLSAEDVEKQKIAGIISRLVQS